MECIIVSVSLLGNTIQSNAKLGSALGERKKQLTGSNGATIMRDFRPRNSSSVQGLVAMEILSQGKEWLE